MLLQHLLTHMEVAGAVLASFLELVNLNQLLSAVGGEAPEFGYAVCPEPARALFAGRFNNPRLAGPASRRQKQTCRTLACAAHHCRLAAHHLWRTIVVKIMPPPHSPCNWSPQKLSQWWLPSFMTLPWVVSQGDLKT